MKRLREEARTILNHPERILARDAWFEKLNRLYAGTYEGKQIYIKGVVGRGCFDPYTQPYAWLVSCLEDLAERAERAERDDTFVPLAVETGHYGVHFVDKLLGADVFFRDGQWNARYLRTEIGELKDVDFENSESFRPLKIALNAFLEQDVALPLFGLPTLANSLNIAVNLYGQEFLSGLLLEPERARHDLRVINNLIVRLHRYYIERLPKRQLQPVISWERTQPPGYGQLCGCSNQLLSPALYAEFVAPLDDELLGAYEAGGMMHICGSHTQHIETFKEMKNLKSLQMNDRAACDLRAYFDGLREDQIFWLNPCETFTAGDAIRCTNGKRLVLAGTDCPDSRR